MRAPQHPTGKAKQRGAALMVMLVIMVMGALAFLVSSLNTSSLKTARQETTAQALAQAKEALIGRAVTDDTRPGSLPCPDLITNTTSPILNIPNDGVADSLSGNDCPSYIGRLPWKTLGLPDLRDGAGERLWYVLSPNFRDDNSNPINSDSAGTLSVSGNISANNVIAIVFAPGQNLPGQDRSTVNTNSYSHYLESVITAYTAFKLSTTDDRQGGGYTYNDQLALITNDNLFQVTEKAVEKHLKNSPFSQLLNTYYTTWGALPFASTINTMHGLLPMSGTADTPIWNVINGTGTGAYTCSLRSATASCTSNCISARCNLLSGSLAAGDVVEITGTMNNIGMGFWRPYNPAVGTDMTASCTQEVCVRVTISGTRYYYPASSIMDNVQIILGSIDSSGKATITFRGTVRSGTPIPERVQFSTSGIPDYSSLAPSWFSTNNWHKVMYYAVSPGYVPGGGNNCTALPGSPSCLTLMGSGGGDSKRAIVVMAGITLSGQIRPPVVDPINYLEGENATPADFIYENKPRSSSFNDQVIVVAP